MNEPVNELLQRAIWPAAELGAAARALVREGGLVADPPALSGPAAELDGDVAAWMADAGTRLGVEIVEVNSTFGELGDMLRRLGPSLLRLPGPGPGRYLAVLRGGARRMKIVAPDGGVERLDARVVRDALAHDLLAPALTSARALMDRLGLAATGDDAGLRSFVDERLREAPVPGCWLIRPSPASAAMGQARTAHVPLLFVLLIVTRALTTLLLLMVWWMVGKAVLAGDLDRSSLTLWGMCLLSAVPLRMLDAWAQGRLSLDTGALFKESLLHGILHLDRATTRARGAGQFMGMAMEGEVSSTAMETALVVLASLVEILAVLVVLTLGVGGSVHALLLVGWVAFTAWLCWRYAAVAERWAASYREVTHDLVERLVGYQTRLLQERPEDRHQEEDALLSAYLATSQELDRRGLVINGTVRTGWLLLGLGALAPALLSGEGLGPTMAVALGGVMMAAGSLGKLVGGVVHMVDVWVSWQQTAPILQAGLRGWTRDAAVRLTPRRSPAASTDVTLLRFTDLSLRYGAGRPAVLHGCSQEIRAGDRVLLEGPSGGGKSTLATLLAGLRAPDGGELWLQGERSDEVPPERWRGRVVLVPQFHDNHILTESLLFNLLLGRCWPPAGADVQDAEATCDLLGLTPLLQRMPQGLSQTVGDGGWALSHGERSRVFLARALLQKDVALVILDESFAALDPETLRLACQGIVASAPTLLVIAHP